MHTTWAFSELSHARKTGLTVAVEQAEPLFVPGARSAGKQRAISWCVLAHPATFQDTRWKGALSEVEADIPKKRGKTKERESHTGTLVYRY